MVTDLAGPVSVVVERMGERAIEGKPLEEVAAFWRKYEDLSRDVNALGIQLSQTRKMSNKLMAAAMKANVSSEVLEEIDALSQELDALDSELNGHPAKNQIGERSRPNIGARLFALNRGISTSTYGPTPTHLETMEIIVKQQKAMEVTLSQLESEADQLAQIIVAAGGSWVEGE